jgi:DDE superfamily endonuclease/Tc5 transposase DNA-binding domain/Fission yeast centromere protein N-terminal domain
VILAKILILNLIQNLLNMAEEPQKRRRTAYTDDQKRRVRLYAQANLSKPQAEIITWASNELNISIRQNTLSQWTSKHYAHLDTQQILNPHAKRHRQRAYDALELALFEWIKKFEKKITISGEVLKHKAQQFFAKIEQYKSKDAPKFSNGWLQNFQNKYGIKNRSQHGELGSAIELNVDEEISDIQKDLEQYPVNDQYNCDETALYWKQIPDKSLSTQELPGRKEKKDRITAMHTYNALGTRRMKVWYIGKAKRPYAFRKRGCAIKNFNTVWYSNKKGWMNTLIMVDYLRWFDAQMDHRVILLMDNFSAHSAAVEFIEKSIQPLRWTTIRFFPPNVTSKHQPLDQGIIASWKAHWKRRWLQFMVDEAEAGRDPLDHMDILKAVRWGIDAWALDVSEQTIRNCWRKSGLHGVALEAEHTPKGWDKDTVYKEAQELIKKVAEHHNISNLMSTESFLNPPDEVVEDDPEEIEEQILEMFQPEEEEEEDEATEELVSPVSIKEAMAALEVLTLYEEQADGGDGDFLTRLEKQRRLLLLKKSTEGTQAKIDLYFRPNLV